MKYYELMFAKLTTGLSPVHLELLNESPAHGLPESAEKHFKVVAISDSFKNLSRIERHRLVHALVDDELKAHVHALSVQAYTPDEWKARGGAIFDSPKCLGGGKREGVGRS